MEVYTSHIAGLLIGLIQAVPLFHFPARPQGLFEETRNAHGDARAAPAVDCDSDLGALSPEEHAAGTLLRSVCAASCGVCGAEAGAGAPEAPGAREQEEGA